MKTHRIRRIGALSVVMISASFVTEVAGEIVFTFAPTPTGSGTVITAIGSVDVRGLAKVGSHGIPQAVLEHNPDDVFRSTPSLADSYRIGTRTALFDVAVGFQHSSDVQDPLLISGDEFGITTQAGFTDLFVPRGFTNGAISGHVTFLDVPLASIRVIEQQFAWGPGEAQRASIRVVPGSASAAFVIPWTLLMLRRSRTSDAATSELLTGARRNSKSQSHGLTTHRARTSQPSQRGGLSLPP